MGLREERGVKEFDQFSESYRSLLNQSIRLTGETGEYFAAYKAWFVAAKVAPKPNCKILDYGCGIGLVCCQMKQQLPQARIDGYDVSDASLGQIDPALRAQGTFTSEMRDLGRDYDVAILANVLHHVRPEDRQDTISQVAGLLGVDGRLVIFEHNPANPLTRRAVANCPFDEDAILLPPRETLGYFSSGKFHKVRLEYIVFFPRALKWFRALEPFLGWCPLGAQYAVVGSGA
jgi:2-polyprenyl-3-methyl-5-hydroxy-6-metoxy-1,4-benzoquinol methylase